MIDKNYIWDYLINNGHCSEEALLVATKLNGYSEKTLLDVLYVLTGYRSLDQIKEH